MLLRPGFRPHLRVQVAEGEGVFLLWETGQVLLEAPVFRRLAPYIDGERTADEIVDLLEDECSPELVYYALGQLERRGYLAEGADATASSALWATWGIDGRVVQDRLAGATVSVAAVGDVDAAGLVDALTGAGVRVGTGESLAVVVADDYLRSDLLDHNHEALARDRPWLLARPVGAQLWIGPLFRPGITACWECLARRLRINRPVESYVAFQRLGRPEPAPIAFSSTAATRGVAFGLLATAVAAWIVEGASPRGGSIVTLDALTWKSETHSVVRQADCPACGGAAPSSRPGEPLILQRRHKRFTVDGGHRAVRPEQTLERLGHHVSPLTGAVTALTRSGPPGGVVHVYSSTQNLPARSPDLEELRRTLGGGKSGKGASDVQARTSALCEALERHSGTFRGDEMRVRARSADLAERAIHPSDILLYSERQVRERERWNSRDTRYNFVLPPLSDAAEVSWTPVWSITHCDVRYVPTACCYYGFFDEGVTPFALACSNGSAAGNNVEEAVLQGLLELVERDSIAIWWYNRIPRPAVDIDSFRVPYLGRVRDFLRSRHRDLWVLDLTADLGIPVFAALSRRLDRSPERVLLGFGAHLDPRIALLRAVTELNQMLTWVISMETDPPEPIEDWETRTWLLTASTADQPHLLPDSRTPPRLAADYPRRWHDDLSDDVRWCESVVEDNGMQLLVLDQTRSDVGLSVVKVFVPGLRHFWARFAPGRLYDVPVQLGWLERPLAEEELNPIPMFI